MKSFFRLTCLFVFTVLIIISCKSKIDYKIKTGGPEIVEFRALPFKLTEVKLLDGPFKKATELNIKILLNYEPDRLLAKFRIEAGLKPKAKHYEGWEDQTIAGHSLGHYLSACALMYQTTGDTAFLNRANYIVDELGVCQDADKEGYIGAIPNGKKVFENEVAKGNIRSAGFDLNGLWSPFYTEHKVMAGLRDAYHLCGNKKALEIEKKFAGWIEKIVGNLTDEQVQKMLQCEHGGINEVLAELYGDTKDERYLKMSRIFHHKAILDSLCAGIDILPNKHANTQIPKIIGLAYRYELTGDTSDRKTAEFFWDRVVHHHSYVTGGHGNDEYFGKPDQLRDRLGPNTTETCNVYNMLKLTEHLFEWNASPDVADFYERALLNHIHSSQNPIDGHVVYNLSLDMGGIKEFQDPYWFTCCIGTGMETHSKYEGCIYYHNNEELFVNQFIASELTWKDKGIVLRQITNYPEEQGTTLEFSCDKPVKLIVNIRYPYWARNGMNIFINKKKIHIKQALSSFIALSRTWKKGDKIEVKIPFSLRLENMPDDTSRVAVFYGPVVLAGILGPEQDSSANDAMYVPVLMTNDRNPANWTEPVSGQVNQFMTKGVGKPRDIQLVPFYSVYNKHYSIYWDIFTEEKWKNREKEYREEMDRRKKIEAMTIDFVQPGEMQPERDHNFKGEKIDEPWFFKDRGNRDSRGGWFSFDLKIIPNQPFALVVDYWGGFPGAKTFDILVNEKIIATENISDKKDGQFISIKYDIPKEIIIKKGKITVKFKAHPNNMAGPVFGVRTVKI